MALNVENPWNIQSIYDFQFFICPSCDFKDHSKQEFVNHTFDTHPDSIEYLSNIHDDSYNDVLCPWDIKNIKIEEIFIKKEDSAKDPLFFEESNIFLKQHLKLLHLNPV